MSAHRIKVCGLTQAPDAELAAEQGAWALGFVFWAKSPRAITPEKAALIIAPIAKRYPELLTVGVFVNASAAEIQRATKLSGVRAVQLHGDERPEFCEHLRAKIHPVGLIKALRLRTSAELSQIQDFDHACQAILLDTYVEGSPGGTGVKGDWRLAREAGLMGQIILAGGLTPENIAQALREAKPYAVDVSSGLETAPGIKSIEKMKLFFKNAGSVQ